MNHYISANTNSYYIMAWVSFIIAFGGGLTGVWLMEGTPATKGFLAITFVFMISSCFTLAKTIRDRHEEKQLVNRVEKAKTEKLLNEYVEPAV